MAVASALAANLSPCNGHGVVMVKRPSLRLTWHMHDLFECPRKPPAGASDTRPGQQHQLEGSGAVETAIHQ